LNGPERVRNFTGEVISIAGFVLSGDPTARCMLRRSGDFPDGS